MIQRAPSDAEPPSWLSQLTPVIEAGLAPDKRQRFEKTLTWAAKKWGALDVAAWERVRLGLLRDAILGTLDYAASSRPSLSADYWIGVQRGVAAVLAALEGQGDLPAAPREIEPWSIPEGYDMWPDPCADGGKEEPAIWAAKCAAEAAYDASRRLDNIVTAVARKVMESRQPDAGAILDRHFSVAMSLEINAGEASKSFQ